MTRPEVDALIEFALARGAESAYRTVVTALVEFGEHAPGALALRLGDVLPVLVDAITTQADEAAALAAKHAPGAGWALA